MREKEFGLPMKDLDRPRIVKISRNQKSLLDYNESGVYVPYRREPPEFYRQAKSLFTDKELVLLVLWAIISPYAALAYLIWTKYEHLKLLAVILFAVSIIHFIVQWGIIYNTAKAFSQTTDIPQAFFRFF